MEVSCDRTCTLVYKLFVGSKLQYTVSFQDFRNDGRMFDDVNKLYFVGMRLKLAPNFPIGNYFSVPGVLISGVWGSSAK